MKQDAHVCVSFDVADESEVAGTGVADVCVDGDGAACVSGIYIGERRRGPGCVIISGCDGDMADLQRCDSTLRREHSALVQCHSPVLPSSPTLLLLP